MPVKIIFETFVMFLLKDILEAVEEEIESGVDIVYIGKEPSLGLFMANKLLVLFRAGGPRIS